MKKFLKRYWHDVPFFGLAVWAVLTASFVIGLVTFTYFFTVVVKRETKIHRREQSEKYLKEKKV